MRRLAAGLLCSAAALLCAPTGGMAAEPVATPARFDFDRTPGRLPKDARPSRYRLLLELDPQRERFGGEVAIDLQVRRAMPALVLHAQELEAAGATLDKAGGPPRALRIDAEATAALWRLVPADGAPIAPGRYTVRLRYEGRVHAAGDGLFRVEHEGQRMLFTQLESVFARTLFPGFDEPAFRAVFELSIRAPSGLEVASNMPRRSRRNEGATALHRFAPTPPMPSYLLALTVGRFDVLAGSAAGVPLRILTAPGRREQARYALDATRRLLPYYNRYFGLPYALPKLDQLAVPGVRDGAMEDWGLISYAEDGLLVDPQHSRPDAEREVFSLMAHEISHQWFGNLVTASSWDEIWLNEAFATWMENKATDHFNPGWQTPLHTRRHIDRTMVRDASAATRAIRTGPVDENLVTSQFDNITYGKGGAVLSMLEQWLGPAAFQRGLAAYMRERRYSNAGAGDLWHHMGRASGRDVASVAGSWTDQPGVPLVELQQDCRDGRTLVTLRQRRFAIEPGLAPQRWQIPVRLQQGARMVSLLLEDDTAQQAFDGCGDEPIRGNAGGLGYYRVAYGTAQRARLAADFARLPPADRMTLLSDAFALAQAGEQPLGDYLALLQQLSKVTDASRSALFSQAGDALRFLDEALAGLPAQGRLRAAGRALLAPELQRLGWQPRSGETSEETGLRVRLIQWLARFDDAAVIAEAGAWYDADAAGQRPLPAAVRPGVAGAVGMHASRAQFERLRSQLLASTREEERWMLSHALAASGERTQVEEVLQLSLAGTLPPNIAAALPGLVGEAGRFGSLAYEFAKANWPALAALSGSGGFGASQWLLPNAASASHDPAQAAALIEDQRRINPTGTAEAARVAARISLRAAVRAREGERFAAP